MNVCLSKDQEYVTYSPIRLELSYPGTPIWLALGKVYLVIHDRYEMLLFHESLRT